MKKHYRHENNCLNCETMLEGKFCHNCGQENLHINESFGHMMNHAISDYFHFDHQFFHTLKPLLFKPGFLTNEYMAGRRAQYLHPVKMYIFVSIVYFLLVFSEGMNPSQLENKPVTKETIKNANARIDKNTDLTPQQKLIAHEQVKKFGNVTISSKRPGDTSKYVNFTRSGKGFVSSASDTTYSQYLASQQKLPVSKRDNLFYRYYNKKGFALNSPNVNVNEIVKDGIKHNFPKMMFLLLPLLALILRVTFWRNKKFYVEHLIYAFHLHCFIFLFLTVVILLKILVPLDWSVASDWIGFLAFIILNWYVYKSLRLVYKRSVFRTITKMIGMAIVYTFVFSVCFTVLIIFTLTTV